MASGLFTIASSGLRAARAALDVTSQNIANANTEGYVRRSLSLAEVASAGGPGRIGDISLSGVRVSGLNRNADLFRQAEVRRTTSDAQRAATELKGMENAEAALEQANLFPAMTAFESALARLSADPTDTSLRAAALEDARTLTRTFSIAAQGLDTAGEGLRFEATDGTGQVNLLATELARVNLQLTRSGEGTSDQVNLLDKRDGLLQQLSAFADLSTSFAADHTVEVRLGGSGGPQLVTGGSAAPLAMAIAVDGTISFTLGAAAVTLGGGSLAGAAQALTGLRDTHDSLDVIAANLIATLNAAQGGGVALDGSAGQPFLSGSNAADIALALTSGNQIATAPSGAGAGSRDPANLEAMRSALSGNDVSGQIDGLLFTVSSAVAGRRTTGEALDAIAASARLALDQQAGVDLDQEAVNLVRFQQAFQASGKAIQVAASLFDTLLALD
jgi:flagellar hook-associated protein 1 FlgK